MHAASEAPVAAMFWDKFDRTGTEKCLPPTMPNCPRRLDWVRHYLWTPACMSNEPTEGHYAACNRQHSSLYAWGSKISHQSQIISRHFWFPPKVHTSDGAEDPLVLVVSRTHRSWNAGEQTQAGCGEVVQTQLCLPSLMLIEYLA